MSHIWRRFLSVSQKNIKILISKTLATMSYSQKSYILTLRIRCAGFNQTFVLCSALDRAIICTLVTSTLNTISRLFVLILGPNSLELKKNTAAFIKSSTPAQNRTSSVQLKIVSDNWSSRSHGFVTKAKGKISNLLFNFFASKSKTYKLITQEVLDRSTESFVVCLIYLARWLKFPRQHHLKPI